MHTEFGAGPAKDARRVLERMAVHSLAQLDELVDDFMVQVRTIPTYAAGAVADPVLQAAAERSINLLLRTIAYGADPSTVDRVSEEVGRARADEGVPLADLMRAVRLDFRVIWASFINQLRSDELPVMLIGAMEVWGAVEGHAERVLIAYQERVAEAARALEDEQRRWFDQLLRTDGTRSDVVARVSQLLRFEPDLELSVLVGARETSGFEAFRRAAAAEGVRCHLHDAGDLEILVCQPRPGRALTDLSGVRCIVIQPVTGLRRVPHAVRLGLAGLDSVGSPERALPVRATWLPLAASRMGEFAPDLIADVLGSLAETDEHERLRLIETVETFLETGSVSLTATRLYCHRNTVSNRLGRFAELTGNDVADPRRTANVQLALWAMKALDSI